MLNPRKLYSATRFVMTAVGAVAPCSFEPPTRISFAADAAERAVEPSIARTTERADAEEATTRIGSPVSAIRRMSPALKYEPSSAVTSIDVATEVADAESADTCGS